MSSALSISASSSRPIIERDSWRREQSSSICAALALAITSDSQSAGPAAGRTKRERP